MNVNLQHKLTKEVRQAKVGYSWTTLFFCFFPALFRGDWKWALIIGLSAMCTNALTMAFTVVGLGFLVTLVFSFIYNKIYINDLLKNDFRPTDQNSMNILKNEGFEF